MSARSVRDAFKYLFPGELDELQELVSELPSNPVVVNIGAGSGTSGLAFMEVRNDITLYTIDITNHDSPFGSLYSERELFKSEGYPKDGQTWQQIHGDSKSVGKDWQYGPVDMVFIDGDHSYEGCKGDIEAWSPHIKPGGILAIHDYDKDTAYARLAMIGQYDLKDLPHFRAWEGVDKAVNEFRETQTDYLPMPLIQDTMIVFFKETLYGRLGKHKVDYPLGK